MRQFLIFVCFIFWFSYSQTQAQAENLKPKNETTIKNVKPKNETKIENLKPKNESAILKSIRKDAESRREKDKKENDYSNINKYRVDRDTNKHIEIGSADSCGENMLFFGLQNNETLGQCDCDYNKCSRPLIYSEKTKACHYAWTKGPCEIGEWYTFGKDLKPICEPIGHCKETVVKGENDNISQFNFKNPKDGKCYRSLTKGYCKEKNELLLITSGDPIPRCRTARLCSAISFPALTICEPGNRMHSEGHC